MTHVFAPPARAAVADPPERPRKGESTRAAIVDAALGIARREGLEGLTIGLLAEALGMSKSGVFAHFGSREDLQLAVLREYAARFIDDVLRPAVELERGLPRLQAMLENWLRLLARELEQGCLMIAGASEYDDRPGVLRDAMVAIVMGWKDELLRAIEAAKAAGHLRAGVESRQLVFEIYGLMLALHQDARLLRSSDGVKRARAGLARLIDAGRSRRAGRGAAADRSVAKSPGGRAQRARVRRLQSS
ncbi:MAG TPA: TetR/AcrR family transcriptional regulator [Burkholderiaceae bacterium]|nr:TetR/AcrR family transcriptional regulator [Burkholderiaceae bacterium]